MPPRLNFYLWVDLIVAFLFRLFIPFLILPKVLCAGLDVFIGRGAFTPTPVALFFTQEPKNLENIKRIVLNDLRNSGVLRLNPQSHTPQNVTLLEKDILYKDWRSQGLQFLVVIKIFEEKKRICVRCKVWDLLQEKLVTNTKMNASPLSLFLLAHKLSNLIYKSITGTEGYFDTQVMYVGSTGSGKKQRFSLGRMHLDGRQHQYLSSFTSLLKSPLVDAARQRVFYIRNAKISRNQIFVFDIKKQKEEKLQIPGNVLSFRLVKSDPDRLLVSVQEKGKTLTGYFFMSKKKFVSLLPPYEGIQTSASFNDKTGDIVFNSNCLGRPRLFLLPQKGKFYPLSVSQGSCYSPVWSLKGDRLAFVRRDNFGFNLSVLRPYTGGEKTLTTFYWLECPFWTPSGSGIIFTGMRGPKDVRQLYFIDLNSLKFWKLRTPDDAIEPCSSDLLT